MLIPSMQPIKEIIITDTEKNYSRGRQFQKDVVGKKIDLRLDERIEKNHANLKK